MNSCLWFFGLVEFFLGGGGVIPPERPRIKTSQSGGLGDGINTAVVPAPIEYFFYFNDPLFISTVIVVSQ